MSCRIIDWRYVIRGGLFSDIGILTTSNLGAVYPAQALLLTRLIVAFELPDDEIQTAVDFFALMSFIVAIVLFATYLCIGWITNAISQVSDIFCESLQSSLVLIADVCRRYSPEDIGSSY